MIRIENVIGRCYDGRADLRDPETLETFYVHRCGVDLQTEVVLGYDAPSVSDHFTGRDKTYPEVAKATGGENAYAIMIGGNLGPPELDGKIWQTLPLAEIGYHARRFSKAGLGIGLIFDGRYKPASPKQHASLVDILALLCVGYGKDPFRCVKGHGEEAGAHDGSKAPGKPAACPGDLLRMNPLRDDIAQIMKESARRKLADAGLIYGAG